MFNSIDSHNPYFNRWFSAIKVCGRINMGSIVTILILIDGFLQYEIIAYTGVLE